MSLRIVISGFLLRYPLGGFSFHHLQYLVGLRELGHDVTYFEHFGWPRSCYDADADDMTTSASYGARYLADLMRRHELGKWCYLAEDGTTHGTISRPDLADALRECDLYINLSNVNWIDEAEHCRRRVLVDTDPVFTQIDGHGLRSRVERHQVLFTYGENVHRDGCTMPTAGLHWLPTRQPVVSSLWPVEPADASSPITTVMNWQAYEPREFEGKRYGHKDMEFEPFLTFAREHRLRVLMAVGARREVRQMLNDCGWTSVSARHVTRDPASYQAFIRASKAEFSVAKHGYVVTQCGWFSDRSTGYLASGRPVVVQDTGFSRFLPCGAGLLAWRTPQQALASIRSLDDDYAKHQRAARALVQEHFAAEKVLGDLLQRCT